MACAFPFFFDAAYTDSSRTLACVAGLYALQMSLMRAATVLTPFGCVFLLLTVLVLVGVAALPVLLLSIVLVLWLLPVVVPFVPSVDGLLCCPLFACE